MNSNRILAKPNWQHFLHIDEVYELPLSALVAADQLLDAIRLSGTIQPTSTDYALWAQSASNEDPAAWLERLAMAAAVILPSELKEIQAARAHLLSLLTIQNIDERDSQRAPKVPWDPCAIRDNRWPRTVSLPPWELPYHWQTALRRAARGLPGKKAAAPARDILHRMREKLCQLAWSARKAGLVIDMTEEVVFRYLEDLEIRLRMRPHGIRWATLRATVEELHRFSRYIGILSDEDQRYLTKRLSRYEFFERGQDALKFAALLETGNTTLGILDKADRLLEKAVQEEDPRSRHRLRNAGAILGLYSIVPLRNADAELILGETLLWESGTWVIDTPIQKTMARSPDHLVAPLEPEICRYIDAVVLGDYDPRHLPELRERAIRSKRLLIVHPNGNAPCSTHIPRIFKEHTGNSFTTTRTMLHTDQAISRGEVGTRDTMVMAHQTSPKIAKKYQEKRIHLVAISRAQDATASRRAAMMAPELLETFRALNFEESHE